MTQNNHPVMFISRKLSKSESNYSNIERIELLPFHKMGEFKWAELGLDYKLSDVQEPDKTAVVKAMAILKKHNLNIVTG